jgi:hypothetical protein
VNWLEWHRIVAYRDVRDVPRFVLAANAAEDAFWILNASSDDGSDALSPIYTIHAAGHAPAEAQACFATYAEDPDAFPAIGCIPVDHVQFDDTGRAALKLTSPPIT